MKVKILNSEEKTEREIELPKIFFSKIREDIVQKTYEAEKKISPYSPFLMAGKQHSASGKIRHSRKVWKTQYGHGISRVPRKIFWRRGNQFYWVAAEVASTRGGRRAHPPRIEHFLARKKINKKEKSLALKSGIAATCSSEMIKKRYSSLKDKKLEINLPLIISSEILKLKTKEFFSFLEKNLGDLQDLAIQNKKIRAGKGKARGRKYKKSAGLLLVVSNNEKFKILGIDVKKVSELKISDLWPLGRLTAYTEQAVQELGEKLK